MSGKSITTSSATKIKRTNVEDIEAMTVELLDIDKQLNNCNDELWNLNDVLDQVSFSKEVYDLRSAEVKKKMQRLVTRL